MEHARGTGVREGMENDHPGRVAMWRRESRVCSRGRAPRDRPVATPDSLRAHRASRSLRSGSWRSPVRRPLIVRPPSRRAPPASTQTKSSLCPAHRRATALRPDGRAQTQPAPHTRRTGPPRPADVEAGVRPTCRVAAPRGGMVAARGWQGHAPRRPDGGFGGVSVVRAGWIGAERGAMVHGRWPCGSLLPYTERPATGHTPPYGKRASRAPALRGLAFACVPQSSSAWFRPPPFRNLIRTTSSPAAPCTYVRRTLSPPALPCEQRQPGLLNDCTTILATSRP